MRLNDDIRCLVGLISDTGLRLSEATGLAIDDIFLDDEIPHLIIQPHPWRRLKTKGSHRTIPLVGLSLWSAKQIKKNNTCQYAFPRYIRNNECLSNSASAAVNKWLKTFIPKECSISKIVYVTMNIFTINADTNCCPINIFFIRL